MAATQSVPSQVETDCCDDQLPDSPYPESLRSKLCQEFPHLHGEGRTIYLDNAGAALYSQTQIDRMADGLKQNIFANPHR